MLIRTLIIKEVKNLDFNKATQGKGISVRILKENASFSLNISAAMLMIQLIQQILNIFQISQCISGF